MRILLVAILVIPVISLAADHRGMTGRQIMDEIYKRHEQYPYVYEEQSMVLLDSQGNDETRTLRRYSRVSSDGHTNLLLLFDTPTDVEGVALLAKRGSTGEVSQLIYLPALGGEMLKNAEACMVRCGDHFLGTDFSIENLVGESLDDYHYERIDNIVINEVPYFVVMVYPGDQQDYPLRRHYVREDSFFITRTDHLDQLGRSTRRQTFHDIVNVHGDMWRANMLLMENLVDDHRTVIKIEQRVFSADYVPEKVFTRDWIKSNQPPLEAKDADKIPEAIVAEVETP